MKKNIRLNKVWENLLINFLMVPDEFSFITGIIMNIRSHEIIFNIWTS